MALQSGQGVSADGSRAAGGVGSRSWRRAVQFTAVAFQLLVEVRLGHRRLPCLGWLPVRGSTR